MNRHLILVDLDRCFGCFTCEVACKQENDSPKSRLIHVETTIPTRISRNVRTYYIPRLCLHCRRPSCLIVCPVKAISKRKDGIVLVDEKKCIGCKYCVWACPYGLMQFNSEKEVAEKCTMCTQRIDNGLEPACVRNCPAKALRLSDENSIAELIQGRRVIGSNSILYALSVNGHTSAKKMKSLSHGGP